MTRRGFGLETGFDLKLALIAKQILNFFFFRVVLTKMVRDAGISCFSPWQARIFFTAYDRG
jgi:hypothetical protein